MKRWLMVVVVVALSATAFGKKFNHESEVGVVVTGGNTDTQVYSGRTLNTYNASEKSKISFGGSFTQGFTTDPVTDSSTETAKRWDAFGRYDYILNQSWSLFAQQNVESDKFSGFAHRYNTDLGARWNIKKTDKFYTFAELGYRYTIEQNVERNNDAILGPEYEDGEADFQKARAYYELGGQINKNVYGRLWAEYVPNFTESEDWLLTFEPSLGITLSESFSLKLAYRGIYDNQPNQLGNKKFDYTYTTSVIAKF